MEPARLPRRLGAWLLDSLAGQAAFALGLAPLSFVFPDGAPTWLLLTVFEGGLVLVPFALVPALMGGRTLGQRALGLWLVTPEGAPAGALLSGLRGLLKVHLTAGCGMLMVAWAVVGSAPLVLPGAMAGRYVRFPHDWLTGTLVVHAPGGLPPATQRGAPSA